MNISQRDGIWGAAGGRRVEGQRGGFLDQEGYSGTNIRVRFEVPVLSPILCSFEQTFSTDDQDPRDEIRRQLNADK